MGESVQWGRQEGRGCDADKKRGRAPIVHVDGANRPISEELALIQARIDE